MAPNPIPMVLIGFFMISTIVVAATAAYEPSSSSSFADNWKNPLEDIVRDSTMHLEEDSRSHLLQTAGCSSGVALPKLGVPMPNGTKTTSSSTCSTTKASSSSKKTRVSSVIAKASCGVKTPIATTAAPLIDDDMAAWDPYQAIETGSSSQFEGCRKSPIDANAPQDSILCAQRERQEPTVDVIDDIEAPVETLRTTVEKACDHIDEHDQRVICMIHEVLANKGAEEPLSIERDDHKVQVISMLQDDQVIFEDSMENPSLLHE